MKKGFVITELRLEGNSKIPAQVSFREGLNVVTGPSNTGKSYIFECINYMLGSSKTPKNIDEAKGYSSIYLEIKDCNNQYYTLESDLKGGGYKCYKTRIPSRNSCDFTVLKRKHNPDKSETISAFLLSLIGLYQKKIRINGDGKTRYLSYRDVNRFSMIDEERILTKESVIISHYSQETIDKSTLKLIVTGDDDSSIISDISKKEITQRRGKIELLSELISDTEKTLLQFDIKSDINEYLNAISNNIKILEKTHRNTSIIYNEIYSKRGLFVEELLEKESRKKVLDELLHRSSILEQQYVTDIGRLQATIEAGYLFIGNSNDDKKCPICNNLATKDNTTDDDINRIIISCGNEISKISLLEKELKSSQYIIDEEARELKESIVVLKQKIQQLTNELDTSISDNLTNAMVEIKELNIKRDEANKIYSLQNQLTSYIKYRDKIKNSIPSTSSKFTRSLTTTSMNDLSLNIKNILEKCNYSKLTDVHYSEDKNDFVISGSDRELAGKGYRAITYSSFIIGLHELLYAKDYSLGVPVLDSPLVTYKKPKAGKEGITIDIAMDFYRYLSANDLCQVIILENEEPPIDISEKINHIVFTQSNNGRYGFIPNNG